MNYGLLYAALTALGFKRGGGGSTPTNPTPIRITASRALLSTDNNAVLYTQSGDSGTYALTVPTGLGNFSCTVIQLGTNPISCSPGVGVTMVVTGSTAGVNTAIALTKADATAEIYDLFLPTVVPAKATNPQTVYPATDNSTFTTPQIVSQLIALAPVATYAYTGVSTGLAAAVPTPTNGQVVLLTDAIWGGSGASTPANGEEWVYISAKTRWFPKNNIIFSISNNTAGTAGSPTGGAQYIGEFQLPAITSGSGQRIRVNGIYGKTGTNQSLTFNVRLSTSTSAGTAVTTGNNVLAAANLKGYFQADVMYDSATSLHECGGIGIAVQSSAPTLVTGLTAATGLWINPQFTPGGTADTPILYTLNVELLPYAGV